MARWARSRSSHFESANLYTRGQWPAYFTAFQQTAYVGFSRAAAPNAQWGRMSHHAERERWVPLPAGFVTWLAPQPVSLANYAKPQPQVRTAALAQALRTSAMTIARY